MAFTDGLPEKDIQYIKWFPIKGFADRYDTGVYADIEGI